MLYRLHMVGVFYIFLLLDQWYPSSITLSDATVRGTLSYVTEIVTTGCATDGISLGTTFALDFFDCCD